MKKIYSLLLVVVMLLSLCACGGGNEEANKTRTKVPKEDYIAIEEILLTPQKNTGACGVVLKIRNLTNETKDYINTELQVLDENGDLITKESIGIYDLEGEQGGKTGNYVLKCPYEEISSIKIKGYNFGVYSDENSNAVSIKEKYDFVNPLVFTMNEVTTENAVESYLWTVK